MQHKITGRKNENHIMNKRIFHFLAAGIVAVTAIQSCALPTEKKANSEENKKATTTPWHLGIQLWTFHLVSFTSAIDKMDSCGIKYMEAYSGQPLGSISKDSFNIRMSAKSKTVVKKLLEEKGITLFAFGVLNPQSKQEWADIFAFASEMGIKVLSAEPLREDWDYADSLAGNYGIKIAIHDHPKPAPYFQPDSVIAAMKNHPNIYACADIGHWVRSGLDPVKCLQQLAGRIADVHLKDVNAFNNIDADNEILGKGIIDLHAVFSELKRQQYNGQISIEHEQNWYNNVPDVKENITWYNNYMKVLFN